MGLDPSGARLVTGGYDYDVKFWDFAGMDASFKAFRSLQPCEWYVSFNLIPSHLKAECSCRLNSIYNGLNQNTDLYYSNESKMHLNFFRLVSSTYV